MGSILGFIFKINRFNGTCIWRSIKFPQFPGKAADTRPDSPGYLPTKKPLNPSFAKITSGEF